MRGRRRRPLLFALVGLASVAAAIALYATHLLATLELDSLDTRFAIRGTQKPPADLVVVKIDDVTFQDLNKQWPFPRSMHGRVIDRIMADHPKVIAFDVQFTQPAPHHRDDVALEAAIKRTHGRVVLSATETDEHGRTNLLGGERVLRRIGAHPASALFPIDAGGALRRARYEVNKLKTFGVVAAEVGDHRTIGPGLFGGRSVWIDYYGPPGTIPSISYSKVYKGKFPKGFFHDKVVVVGPTAPSLQDLHPTSTTGADLMSGAEVQANAIENVRRGLPLRDLPGWLDVLLIVLMGLIGPLAMLRLGPLRATVTAVAAAVLFTVGAQLLFNSGRVTTFVYPLLGLALGLVVSLAIETVMGAIDRAVVRDRFARFVPKAVVDDVLARADGDLRLGGQEQVATVMFSDVRGFTSFTEALSPADAIGILNEYLSAMSAAILANGGTLVAYMGDGIMAVFGAPIPQEDHADRALAAAREMLGPRLGGFNQWLREQGRGEGFRMGVGLNSGPVMSGMVGSDERLEYTTIGDTTNTAARLEGMTKGTPHQLFMAGSTKESLTSDPGDLVFVDEFPVRGRKATITVYSIADDGSNAPAPAAAAAGGQEPAPA